MLDSGGGIGFGHAGGDLRALGPRIVHDAGQLLICIGFGDLRLSVVSLLQKLPEGVIRASSNTVGVGRCFACPVVRWEREILENKTRLRLFRQKLLNNGLRLFAVWALQVAELHNGDRGIRWTTRRSVHSFLQFLPGGGERSWSEGDDVSNHRVLSVGSDVELVALRPLRSRH